MKKAVITAFDITTARKAGQTRVIVPAGALVTPQASDDARDYGIALAREEETSITAPASGSLSGNAHAAMKSGVAEEIRRQVLSRLGRTAPDILDAIISSVLADAAGHPAEAGSLIRKSGGVCLVPSSALAANGREVPPDIPGVSLVEAVPPGAAHPGISYMGWENSSFAWTFAHDEILVVLEGDITLETGGGTLAGKPGDSFLVPAGSAAVLSVKGRARCVLCSWPASPGLPVRANPSNLATAKG